MNGTNGASEPVLFVETDNAQYEEAMTELEALIDGGMSEEDATAQVAEKYPDLMELLRALVTSEGTDGEGSESEDAPESPQDAIS